GARRWRVCASAPRRRDGPREAAGPPARPSRLPSGTSAYLSGFPDAVAEARLSRVKLGRGGGLLPGTRIFCVLPERRRPVSWHVRVATRDATQRGPRRQPPPPARR